MNANNELKDNKTNVDKKLKVLTLQLVDKCLCSDPDKFRTIKELFYEHTMPILENYPESTYNNAVRVIEWLEQTVNNCTEESILNLRIGLRNTYPELVDTPLFPNTELFFRPLAGIGGYRLRLRDSTIFIVINDGISRDLQTLAVKQLSESTETFELLYTNDLANDFATAN